MLYAIIDRETAQELFPETVKYMRTSNDKTLVVVHKEILDSARPSVNNLMLDTEEVTYPFPLVSGDEINNMSEFQSLDEII